MNEEHAVLLKDQLEERQRARLWRRLAVFKVADRDRTDIGRLGKLILRPAQESPGCPALSRRNHAADVVQDIEISKGFRFSIAYSFR